MFGFEVLSQFARLSPCLLGRAAFDRTFPGHVGRLVAGHEFVLLVPISDIVDGQGMVAIDAGALKDGFGRTVSYKAFC